MARTRRQSARRVLPRLRRNHRTHWLISNRPSGERKPSVKEIIRSSLMAERSSVPRHVRCRVLPIRHRRRAPSTLSPRRRLRAVGAAMASRLVQLDAIDARGMQPLMPDASPAQARRTRRPASNQKGGRSSSRGCWRGGCGPGAGGWNAARCALCGNQTMSWGILVSLHTI